MSFADTSPAPYLPACVLIWAHPGDTSRVAPVPGRPTEFRTVGHERNDNWPLYRLFDERYVLIWNVSSP